MIRQIQGGLIAQLRERLEDRCMLQCPADLSSARRGAWCQFHNDVGPTGSITFHLRLASDAHNDRPELPCMIADLQPCEVVIAEYGLKRLSAVQRMFDAPTISKSQDVPGCRRTPKFCDSPKNIAYYLLRLLQKSSRFIRIERHVLRHRGEHLHGQSINLGSITGGHLIGYARVSTDGQDLASQRSALKAEGCTRIFEEKVSTAKRDRVQLERMLDHLRPGDTVLVTRLDRLARSTRDLLEIAERLRELGAGLRSLAEPWADTSSPAGRMILTVMAGIADFERSLILERTSTGRKAAKERGVKFGRSKALSDAQIQAAKQMLEQPGATVTAIAAAFKVNRATLYRALAAQ